MRTDPILEAISRPLRELVREQRAIVLPLAPLSACALQAWACAARLRRAVLFVTDGPQTLDLAHRDLLSLSPYGDAPDRAPHYFPAWEALGVERPDPEITGYRLNVLQRLCETRDGAHAPMVAASVQALMQKTMAPDALRAQRRTLSVGDIAEPETVAAELEQQGYTFCPEVSAKGEAVLRGGLLDLWPPTSDWPIRIEWFGDEVVSLRSFDPADQRSVARMATIRIMPVNDRDRLLSDAHAAASLLDYLPPDTIVIRYDTLAIQAHAEALEAAVTGTRLERCVIKPDALDALLAQRAYAQLCYGAESPPPLAPELVFEAVHGVFELPHGFLEPDLRAQTRQRLLDSLRERVAQGQSVTLYCETAGSTLHLRESLPHPDRHAPRIVSGGLSSGFVNTALNCVILSEADLYGRKAMTQRYDPNPQTDRPPARVGPRITNLADLEPGDLVVHVDHGLGRYRGLYDIVMSGKEQEVISIAYADEALLHIPVSHAHLLSRYVGTSKRAPRLHRLGGKRWNREKAEAAVAVEDLAASLLETQAHRNLLEGHAFAADSPWQHEFATSFPYAETADQVRVIDEVKRDMESRRPMDRLICGDAGYGKTEVAMRAAFKAVMDQKQVALLVPTTVLAQQHYQTFSERMAPYPIRVEMLSRFRTHGARSRILRDMAEGSVDIVIGTHALVQPGIRFRDLGLVIIDEEQRFGVKHKERFKELRRLVDVLTMTATPIPRTLYMSMTGARDMSLLQTPPRERMAIETVVSRDTDDTIRKAVLQELNREGQIFYLHNRVLSIERIRERLERIVPEARIEVAHGQMAAAELAAIMQRFVAGAFDILLCTTIIESGVDIPRANTILIDRADRFGIAELYQLRGRVGRSSHKAYAYFLLPATGRIEADARERIAAIEKYSSLSAGFNLALRDLEIRGAGNMLGTAQSGHIAAVGFALYCQLLKRSVARLSGKPMPRLVETMMNLDFIDSSSLNADSPAAAMIPYTYIEQEQMRVDCYRRIAEATDEADMEAVETDFRDRFGPPPPPVQRLLTLARLRVRAAAKGIRRVETRGRKVMIGGYEDLYMPNGRFPRLRATDPDERIREIADMIAGMPA